MMKRTEKRGILPNNKELSPTLTQVFWRESVQKQRRFHRGNKYSYSSPYSSALSPEKLRMPVGAIFTASFNSKAPRDNYVRDKSYLRDITKRNLFRELNRRPIILNKVNEFETQPGSFATMKARTPSIPTRGLFKRRKSSTEKLQELKHLIAYEKRMNSMMSTQISSFFDKDKL